MKKLSILFILLSCFTPAFNQTFKKTSTSNPKLLKNENGAIVPSGQADYEYKIINGERVYDGNYNFNGTSNGVNEKVTGKYKEGYRTGVWKFNASYKNYHNELIILDAGGKFEKGDPIGKWYYIKKIGNKIDRYEFEFNKNDNGISQYDFSSSDGKNKFTFKTENNRMKYMKFKGEDELEISEDYYEFGQSIKSISYDAGTGQKMKVRCKQSLFDGMINPVNYSIYNNEISYVLLIDSIKARFLPIYGYHQNLRLNNTNRWSLGEAISFMRLDGLLVDNNYFVNFDDNIFRYDEYIDLIDVMSIFNTQFMTNAPEHKIYDGCLKGLKNYILKSFSNDNKAFTSIYDTTQFKFYKYKNITEDLFYKSKGLKYALMIDAIQFIHESRGDVHNNSYREDREENKYSTFLNWFKNRFGENAELNKYKFLYSTCEECIQGNYTYPIYKLGNIQCK